ncbi:hypothetical protein ETH_00005530, partial [Eimeria tenella]
TWWTWPRASTACVCTLTTRSSCCSSCRGPTPALSLLYRSSSSSSSSSNSSSSSSAQWTVCRCSTLLSDAS